MSLHGLQLLFIKKPKSAKGVCNRWPFQSVCNRELGARKAANKINMTFESPGNIPAALLSRLLAEVPRSKQPQWSFERGAREG